VFLLDWIKNLSLRIARQSSEPLVYLYHHWLQDDPENPRHKENRRRRKRLLLAIPAVLLALASTILAIGPRRWSSTIQRNYAQRLEQLVESSNESQLAKLGYRILSDSNVFGSEDRFNFAVQLAALNSAEHSMGSTRILEQLAPDGSQGLAQAHRRRALDGGGILSDRPIDPHKLKALGWHLQQSLNIEDPFLQRLRSDYYLVMGQYDLATVELSKLASQQPEYWFTLAEVLLARSDLNAARDALRRASQSFGKLVSQNPSDHEARIRYSTALGRLGEFDAAIDSMKTGWKLTSDSRFAEGIGEIHRMKFQKLRNLQGSAEQQWIQVQQAMEWSPENPQNYEALSQLCADRNADSIRVQLEEKIEELLLTNQHVAKVLFAKSNLALARGDTTSAKNILENIILKESDFHPALNNLAWIVMDQTENTSQELQMAENYAKRAVELLPHSGSYRDTLGVVFSKQQRWTDAIAQYELALRNSKKPIPTLEKIAQAYQQLGQTDLANQYLLRVEQLRRSERDAGITHQGTGVK